jgi:hypothetical protein
MADRKWKVINPTDGAEFECAARNRKLAYEAASTAGFIEVVNNVRRGIMNYIIQELPDEPSSP